MKTVFSNKHNRLRMRGSMTLLFFAIMITIFTGTLPSYASRSSKSSTPALGISPSVTKMSDFCYAAWTSGLQLQGLNCLKHTKSAVTFLRQAMATDSFAKWPQQVSLATLAQQSQLFNPQTDDPIKTKQDLLTALQSANSQLKSLFDGDAGSKLLDFLWDYVLTSNNAPPPPAPPVNAADQPPTCPGNFQSLQNSDLWPQIGPMLLTRASQQMQDQNGNTLGLYDIYGRLLLQDHCSLGALALTMKALNGDTQISAATVAQWERDTLADIANSPSLANNPSIKGVFSLVGQQDNGLIDTWASAAIMTHPITALTSSTNPVTGGSTPNGGSTPVAVPLSHVEVP